MPVTSKYRPAPRITALGDRFYDEVAPASFPRRVLRFRNDRAAATVGLDGLDAGEWEAAFARFEPLPGNLAKPLALRYHGHQFDVYNPFLGDGRGFLYAQLEDDGASAQGAARSTPDGASAQSAARSTPEPGRLLDLGTKGSGTTPWSRGGDGRLTLKGGVREVLATEMLEALGVPTSRTLSLFETGERLVRGDEPSPTRSSVLVRLSHSHVRFGTFQRLAHLGDADALDALLRYAIARYYPGLASLASVTAATDRVSAFLAEVTKRSAALAAGFMVAGFVHGVLNSDNMNVTGEAFDYGPYRFLPTYDLGFTAAYFDHGGLYAYGRQPRAIFRNVVRLAEALRPLAPEMALAPAIGSFEDVLQEETKRLVLARLGLAPNGDTDLALVDAWFHFLAESGAGYEQAYFDVRGGRTDRGGYSGPRWDALRELLALYTPAPGAMTAYFDGDAPCTLLIGEIESIWAAIAEREDWGPFEAKVAAIRAMGA